ncbi:hypothetical protein MHM93_07910 [Pseudoalteromonas sp. MM17-2]|uniref:hypothetical protein n=1 Tax=Pseudoalteromonas TaxID=53246 RepID=UPI001247E17E|nr:MULTISPECIES: hypothetical protein [Pseudoalteromonas]MCG7544105.1 hypothetical protein [Pseudoalteromonas sp. MM17-2]|tara:strand:+ start:14689 stop:15057 length:369 start_codon:yes stop_codon:yes gene_type:complete
MPVIIAFLGALVSRIGIWFMTLLITGVIKNIAIGLAAFAIYAAAITTFLFWVDDLLTETINGLGPITQGLLSTWISWLPANMPYYVGLILSYYVTSATFMIGLEIKKFRQRLAEKSTRRFLA